LTAAFSALTLLVRHQEKLSDEVLLPGVVICLERGADCLHMVQLMPMNPKTSSLASFKSRPVGFTFQVPDY